MIVENQELQQTNEQSVLDRLILLNETLANRVNADSLLRRILTFNAMAGFYLGTAFSEVNYGPGILASFGTCAVSAALMINHGRHLWIESHQHS